ncbi:hypothetical protein J1N35_006846 [Gossypium stocksii]|uniref:Uncharacterized protein n=1 Tax=Gossypium stocksii TaxID=47602 RepID=A0A9D3W6F2_9ROSI|nr:hypothetical protein J1N35_006846 [Gossypium stocksii]
MANLRCNCLFFLLMILVLSQKTLLFTEGRSLELKTRLGHGNLFGHGEGDGKSINVAIPSPLHHVFRSLEGYIDAFRPTTPGHSPGVGH